MSADTHPQSENKETLPVTLKGNLGRDAEYSTVHSAKEPDVDILVGKFSLAVNGSDGQSTWYQVTAWRNLAVDMKLLPLGMGAFVEVTGKATSKEITTQTGEKRLVHELTLTRLPTVLRAPGPRRSPQSGGA